MCVTHKYNYRNHSIVAKIRHWPFRLVKLFLASWREFLMQFIYTNNVYIRLLFSYPGNFFPSAFRTDVFIEVKSVTL